MRVWFAHHAFFHRRHCALNGREKPGAKGPSQFSGLSFWLVIDYGGTDSFHFNGSGSVSHHF